MHDEIAKHGKQALDTARRKELPFAKKVKEVALEIFIIVFAVTLSITLHSWSESRREQQQVAEFLSDIRMDLQSDIDDLERTRQMIDSTIAAKAYLLGLSVSLFDSLRNSGDSSRFLAELNHRIPTGMIIQNWSNGNYEGFKSSGKIGYISNKKLKRQILAYYEQELPGIADAEHYYNASVDHMNSILVELNGSKGKDILFNPKLRACIQITLSLGQQNNSNYARIIDLAREVMAECGTVEEH